MTPLCKTNSPAIPLALLRGATTILKGPEVVALQSALVCLRVQNVRDRYEHGCLCPTGRVDSPVLPVPPCPPPVAEGRGATEGLTFNN